MHHSDTIDALHPARFSAELAIDRYIRTGQTVGLGSGPLVGKVVQTCMFEQHRFTKALGSNAPFWI
jgi:hypothetical protein